LFRFPLTRLNMSLSTLARGTPHAVTNTRAPVWTPSPQSERTVFVVAPETGSLT
jgi:hypothetical protein